MVFLWKRPQVDQHNSEDGNHACPARDCPSSPENLVGMGIDSAWTAGHLRHLTPEEEVNLLQFKTLCQQHGYWAPVNNGQADIYDATLLRFLRARSFNVNAAFSQFRTARKWRVENSFNTFYQDVDVNSYEKSKTVFAQWTGRRDRRGFPIYVFPIKNLSREKIETWMSTVNSSYSTNKQNASKTSRHILHFHALYENLLSFVMPLCTQLPRPNMEIPVSASTHIIDIRGVDLTHFWKIRRYLQAASILATTYYPETLGQIFVIGAPPFFLTMWDLIKKWFDPLTISKISILSPLESRSTLLTYIDSASLPKQYGGELPWEWGDMPDLDGPARAIAGGLYQKGENGEEEFLTGPLLLTEGTIQLLGTTDGTKRRNTIPLTINTETLEVSAYIKSMNEELSKISTKA